MNDQQDWRPPTWTNEAPDAVGAFVPPVAPPTTTPPPPQPGMQVPAGSWTAPPKPGLIPLRPLTLGSMLAASFQILRRNPRPTFGFALIVQALIVVVTLVVIGLVSFTALSRVVTGTSADTEELTAGAIGAIILASLVPGVLSIIGMALVQGILVLEIQRATLGEKLKLGQLWRRARGRLGALIGWVFLVMIAVILATVLLVVIIAALSASMGTVGIALGVTIGIFGGLGFLVLSAWLGTKLALVPSVLMGERVGLGRAIVRSWSLTQGYFWRTFGILLLVAFILNVATQVVSTPVQLIAPLLVLLLDPNGTGGPVMVVVTIGIYIVSILVILVLSSVAMVVQSATTALIYIDLRMRKEGLDLDLARHVEEAGAGAGQTGLPDPYLLGSRRAPGGTAAPYGPPSFTGPVPPQNESPWA